jgi:hypothetical protein
MIRRASPASFGAAMSNGPETHRMINRREALQIGIAAAAWPLAAQVAQTSNVAAPAVSPLPLYKVVYDVRFSPSRAFAERAVQLGFAAHAIEGDMTRFWYDDVYHRWKQGAVALAGLTAHGPMFCFEQLAMAERMRVVFRAEHRLAGADGMSHEFFGPVGMLRDARRMIRRSDWAAGMADLVTQCAGGRTGITSTIGRAAPNAVDIDGESLYSWVIAPTAPAAFA